MDRLANGNFNSARFDAAAALLADDLRTASQDFEGALQTHIFSRDDGGFGTVENGRFFEERLAHFLNKVGRIINQRFRELASIASQDREMTLAVESATAVVTSAVREHCNPENILLRAFPALAGEGIDLPPGLTPPGENEPVEAICSRIKVDLDGNVDRIARRTLIHGVSNAAMSTNAEPAGAIATPPVNTSQKPSEPSAVEKLPAKKQDLSRYLDNANLTAKQRECASLKWEYELSDTEIARRLGVHRTTVVEHICAAKKKMHQSRVNEKHAKDKAKSGEP